MYASIEDLLTARQLILTMIDVGSRNGVLELARLAPFVEAYGFEPNPVEYEKLIMGKTDLALAGGLRPPAYRQLSYFPYALGEVCGRRTFYITRAPGAAGLLEPDVDRLREIVWKGRRYEANLAEEIFAPHQTIEVELRTLDEFAAEHGIVHIDYLKIDVEGSEYEVLEGARGLLPRTGVIKVETCFIPFRKGQRLFSHVDLLLREYEFDLLRYEIDPGQVGYKERGGGCPVEFVPKGFPDPHGQPLSCDAIYVNRGVTNPDRALAQAAVLLDRGYVDEGLHVMRAKAGVQDPPFFELLQTGRAFGGTDWKLRQTGYRVVDRVVELAGRLARSISR